MACPICQKRKAKRFCPGKDESICPVCCGTEREVTIDCPGDCPYLVASRPQPGGIGGKGVRAPATTGMTPGKEDPFMEKYLKGEVIHTS